jgi:hypothetical protein
MKIALLLAFCCACLSAQAQRRGVYYDLGAALQQPDKVRVLDLRGQGLKALPPTITSLRNVEAILLSDKLRNLWLYPRSWKYKFHFKHLPAGGYHHLQGRAAGHYYDSNGIRTLPIDFCQFPKLIVLDLRYIYIPATEMDSISTRLSQCHSQTTVLGAYSRNEKNLDAWIIEGSQKRADAKKFLRPFKVKI